MKSKVVVGWKSGMAFEAEVNNHKIILDADSSVGGEDQGPRPKALVLGALGGCSGMDIVAILKKMKQEIRTFRMEIEADASEEHPKVYTNIHIRYIFSGDNLEPDKLQKAVDLSQDKYCSVSAMLKKGTRIDYSIVIE
jgi:putative redox protein